MTQLHNLSNTSRPKKTRVRVGRGQGSGLGKTCGRGQKGMGARSGWGNRAGYEGGQFRTFMKLPIRGFSNAPFRKEYYIINLGDIEKVFEDGELVNILTLREKGLLNNVSKCDRLKVLAKGTLTKKVTIEADAISEQALNKLQQSNIAVKLLKPE